MEDNASQVTVSDEALYELCQRRVDVAARIMDGLEEPDDLIQDLWIKARQAFHTFDPSIASLDTWIERIAVNHARDQLVRRSRFEPMDPAVVESLLENVTEPGQIPDPTDSRIMRVIRQLPPDQLRVFVYRHIIGFSVQEVAAKLSRDPDWVSLLDHRARSFLKQRLRALGLGPIDGSAQRNPMRILPRPSPVLSARRAVAFV